MIVCPICGFRNMDSNSRCFKCSALLKRDETLVRESGKAVSRRTIADRTYRLFAAPLDWLVHRPGISGIFAIPEDGLYRYPFTAGLLSIVPGAGHLYAGQKTKSFLIFVIAAILVIAALLTLRESWSNILLFTMLAYWLITWADSVAVAAQANGDMWRLRKTLALVCAAMMIVGVVVTSLQWFGMNILTLQKVGRVSLGHEIQSGDRVAFSDLPIWFGKPAPGELVLFDPPRFEAHQGKNVYSVNISKYMQRVIGAPGDRVQKIGNQFFRNGKILTPELEPIGGQNLPDFDVRVPAESYFIPVTDIPADVFGGLMGAGDFSFVGQPGYPVPLWPQLGIIPQDDIMAKGIAIINPPKKRRWL